MAADTEPRAEGPYPGLRPFLSSEADIFFGREQMSDEVLVRLNERHMVVVHGASGCGKSSLVAAGVLPQLARRRARRGLTLRIGTFRPGNRPMHSLVETLAQLCTGEGGGAGIEQVYRAVAQGPAARTELARLAKGSGVDQVCVVVDQFEELFRFAEDESFEEAQRFADLLVSLAGAGERPAHWWQEEERPSEPAATEAEISFLLTMRSEFLGDCSRYPGLADAINRTQYLLPNMERPDLIRAIREPAEVFGSTVDHLFAERIADDAAREHDSLPLVQHALMQLWRAEDDGRLTVEDYERALATGGQSEQLRHRTPLGAILAGHADGVLKNVTGDDPERLAAAGFIFRALTRKDSEGRAIRCPQRLRRLERVSGVPAGVTREIVDGFRQEGVSLLTPYQAMQPEIGPDTVIDISHEALIRTWPRMSDRTIDPADAQPIGWVEREAQEAMLWRWVAIHADFFRSNPKAYLDGATTDRLTAWFDTIKRRPDWVRGHLLNPEGREDVTDEPEWHAVAHLLEESRSKTWFDRHMVRRWKRRLRRSAVSVVAVALLVAAAAAWWYDRHRSHEEVESARQQVSTALRVTDNLIAQREQKRGSGSDPRRSEAVDAQLAAAASAGVAGAVLPDNRDRGFIWVGSADRRGRANWNLRAPAGEPVPAARIGTGGTYSMGQAVMVRDGLPSADGTPQSSLGLLTIGAPVRALARPVAFAAGNRTDYWLQAQLRFAPLPEVALEYADDRNRLLPHFRTLLRDAGYRVVAVEPGNRADAAEVLYCREDQREAALRLAATASRKLAQIQGLGVITVAPARRDRCEAAPNRLRLRLDLTPQALVE